MSWIIEFPDVQIWYLQRSQEEAGKMKARLREKRPGEYEEKQKGNKNLRRRDQVEEVKSVILFHPSVME